MSNKYKLILFDFDGTIADYLKHIKPLFNKLAKENNFRLIGDEEEIRSLPSLQMVKYLKIPFFKLPRIIKKAKKLQKEKIGDINIKEGLLEVLNELKDKYKLGILSSNSKEIIVTFLKKHEILHYFEFIDTYPKLFAKFIPMGKILIRNKIKPSEALYVGDEVRDIQATKKVGMHIAAVTWGFNNEFILNKYNPNYIIRKPNDLLKILN